MTTCTTRAAETWAHILAQPDGYPMGVAADWLQEQSDHDGSDEAKAEACAAVEAVAQQHLDAHPGDHKARRLLGEWLQWHGDVRGEGYRALAACGLRPMRSRRSRVYVWFSESVYGRHQASPYFLPGDWYAGAIPQPVTNWWHDYGTRRAAEDAAAIAFARLPAERRAALLKGEM